MKLVQHWGAVLAALLSLLILSSTGLAGQTNQYNLYQEVIAHQGAITWATAPSIPSDVCSMFKTCNGATPKPFVLPAATLNGEKTGRALFLIPTKDAQHPDVVLEHQTTSAAYFFLLGPDGNLKSTAYVESGKPWYLIANELGQSKFDRDKKDWHDWVSKLGAKTPQ